VFEDEEGFHVVLEYCKGAPLLDAIHDKVITLEPGALQMGLGIRLDITISTKQ